jgi:hypothetical protein
VKLEERMDDLTLEEAQELAIDLALLANKQAESLQTFSYIPMFPEQAQNFNGRRKRISEIWDILKEFTPASNHDYAMCAGMA